MVNIIPTKNPEVFRLEADSESWYPLKKTVSAREAAYLDSVQHCMYVKDAIGEWIPYRMTNHQVEWHLDDAVLLRELAPIRVVIKSRNTSLTVNASVSDIIAQAEFSNPVLPYVRLNSRSSGDLIAQVKDIVKHIKPFVLEEPDESKRVSPEIEPPMKRFLYPFNPKEVEMSASGSIGFPNGTSMRGFPANADASETIRGLRLRGVYGFIDEANFMRSFKNIFVAMRDASAGSKDGKKIQQFTIGTTLKGETPFSEWLDGIKKSGTKKIKIYDWPVFRRDLFQPYLDGKCTIPFHENPKLISIVDWHDKKDLWETWLQDPHVFKEEYMAMHVESSEQFYPTKLIIQACDITDSLEISELSNSLANYTEIRIGMDPASKNDFFGIAVFGKCADGHWEMLLCEGHQGVELPDMQSYCDNLLTVINNYHANWLCSIDASPIGLQLTQRFRKSYGQKHVRGLYGNMRFQDADKMMIKLNEFMHTNVKRMMYEEKIHLIADDMLIKHFKVWDYTFNADSGKDGHGDLVMAILYSLCPIDTKNTEDAPLNYSGKLIGNKKFQDTHQSKILKDFKLRMAHKRKFNSR